MLSLPAKLTHDDAQELVRTLRSQITAQPEVVVVAAGQLRDFDSSALAVLLACRRAAQAVGKPFEVCNAPVKLVQLAIKRIAADAQRLRYIADIPAMLCQQLQQHGPLVRLQRLEPGQRGFIVGREAARSCICHARVR